MKDKGENELEDKNVIELKNRNKENLYKNSFRFIKMRKLFLVFVLVLCILFFSIMFSVVSKNYENILITGYSVKKDNASEIITKEVLGSKLVTKVIDGDTIVVEGGYTIRLLGIDADEQGYPCYDDAKKRLEELILSKDVYLEADRKDKDEYNRYLRYVILDKENINIKIVREGLAIARISEEVNKYKNEIIQAEKEAIKNKIGCKWRDATKKENATESEIKSITTVEEKIAKITTTTNNKVENTTLSTTIKVISTTSTIKKENIKSEDEIDACDAINYINEKKVVVGKVVSTYRSKTNTIFLNFGKPYPNQCFSAVIFSSSLSKFPNNPEKYYYGKIVRIRGNITEYEGKPQIILRDAKQIEIIE